MANIFEEKSQEFQSRLLDLSNPIALSYTSLRQLDPKYGGTPMKLAQHFTRPRSLEVNGTKAFVEYMIEGRAYLESRYKIIGDLRTSAAKEALKESNEKGIGWIKASDLDGYDLMQQAVVHNRVFRMFLEDCDTKRCFYDTCKIEMEYFGREGKYFYDFNMFLHFYNPNENALCIIKQGTYADNDKYTWGKSGIELQAAIYAQAKSFDTPPTIYVCTIDKSGNHNAFRVSENSLNVGYGQLQANLWKYQQCFEAGNWNQSFMANNKDEVWTI